MKFHSFSKRWYKVFGWHLFKPLSDEDKHHFKSLHVPLEYNRKEFDEQILSLTKVIIDSLNEKKLVENINTEKNKPKGIDKFEAFLINKGLNLNEMVQFLRNLQTLRSTSVAHRKSNKNKDFAKVSKYFEFDNKSYCRIFQDILIKAIWMLNTLERHFLND